ncbi:TonB-dependent receptor domain-containing protein [Thalassotalea maritima]|uniref:TonB-dependent receptor domain-containing protein n=1 Tax=Thalassotalea maritima TaxID=3242416 RepID=UPI003528BFBD
MYSNNKLAKAVRLALMFGASATAGVSANAMAADEETAEDVERIEVTGSRIKRTDMESASPVFVTSAEDIKLSGFTRVEDLLNTLPQIEAGQTSMISNGASGTASLDLRGMGPNRTLVLVNGRRLQSGGVYSQSPDINQIPAALVKRVEVLTGGASATYGADAVAGVVNFVMDNDFEGLEITAGASGYQHDNDNGYIQGLMDERGFDYPTGNTGIDGKSYNFDVTMGGALGDKGHAVAYATWRRNDELRQESRDYSSCALNAAGDWCGGSGNAIIPNFYLGGVTEGGDFDWGNWDYLTLTQDSNFQQSAGNVYNYAPVNHFMRPDEKFSFGAFVDYEVNDHFMPFMEISFMQDKTKAQIAESGTFFNEQYILPVSQLNDMQQAYLLENLGLTADDEFATYIGKRNVEGGPRASNLEHNSFRIVLGSEGEINDNWSYEVFANYGQTTSSAAYINDFFGPRIATAVDAEACEDDASCLFYDVFTYQGITEEAAASLTGVGILNGTTTSTTVSGYVTGELPLTLPSADAPIAVVLGAEYREEEFERLSDEVYEAGLLLGQGGPTASIFGSYNVRDVFFEASIPVVSGAAFAESLTLDLSGRYSDYNTSGGESTYSAKVDWNVTDDWKVRGSYARAVRAPNIAELFAPQNLGLWGGSDPCAGADPQYTQAQCALTGVTAAQYGNITPSPASQYNGVFGGNPELAPEIADTVSFGLVANPLENLNFTVDYWDIEVEDVIGTQGAQFTVEQCAETGEAKYCDNVVRNGAGSLWLGTEGYVQATNLNLASMHFTGVDTTVNFLYEDAFGGTFRANLNGTYMTKKEFDGTDCAGTIDNGCFAQPEWRHSLKMSYDQGSFWTASVIWRHYGQVDYTEENDLLVLENGGIDAQNYIDVKGAFDVTENLGVLVGINNVFDKEPPMVGGTLSSNGNAIAGFYDTLGRYVHVSATLSF